MAKLPIISGRTLVKVLGKVGYKEVRQQGSPIRLECVGKNAITIPNHKVIGRGLLRKILRDAELSPDEFVEFLLPPLRAFRPYRFCAMESCLADGARIALPAAGQTPLFYFYCACNS